MSIMGTQVKRVEDPRLVLGQGEFSDDVSDPLLDGALHLTFVRSMTAHGRIVEIDVTEARAMPGVLDVFTAADVDLVPASPGGSNAPAEMARPWLATDTVRFVGEAVAIVVAESPSLGVDAAEAVIVDIDPLEAVIGIEAGLSDEVGLFPGVDSNVNSVFDSGWTTDDEFWDGCDVVVRHRVNNPRVAAVPIEGRGSAAVFSDGRLVQWLSTQAPHGARSTIATALGLTTDEVRVIAPDVGGGFGAKINPSPEDILVGWVARRLDRPVRWVEDRSENLLSMVQGRDHLHDLAIGGTRDGKVLAYELDVLCDCGAYPLMGAFLPYFTRLMAPGVYDIPRVRSRARSVVTNTVPTEAFRGAGRPEATTAIERAMDLFAVEVGLDPAECRRRNLLDPSVFPHTTPGGATYDNGDYEGCLDKALAASDYTALRAEQQRRRDQGDPMALGIGVSTYVEITGAGSTKEYGGVRIEAADDGGVTATLLSGSSPHGQGLVTSFAMVASDVLGIPVDRITMLHSDTDLVPWGLGTMGSRSLQMGGSAIHSAGTRVVEAARQLVADELEAAPADIVLDTATGSFHVAGTPSRSLDWAAVVALAAGSNDPAGSPRPGRPGHPRRRRPRTRRWPPATRRGTRCGSRAASTRRGSRSRSAPTCASSRSTRRRGWWTCVGSWRATMPGGSSTRCWRPVSVTAASPRVCPRPCSRASATTSTATR